MWLIKHTPWVRLDTWTLLASMWDTDAHRLSARRRNLREGTRASCSRKVTVQREKTLRSRCARRELCNNHE